MWWKCPNCRRRGEASDARLGIQRASRDEPSYEYEGCKVCAPNGDDDDRARDHAEERAEAEAREF